MFKTLALFLMLCPVLGYSAHITDKLLAGMYAQPNKQQQPIQLLPSGTPVELKGEQKGFVKVQLVDGKVGWVEKHLLSEETPAKVRLLALQSKYRQVQAKLDALEENAVDKTINQVAPAELDALKLSEKALNNSLIEAKKEIAKLQETISQRNEVAAEKVAELEPVAGENPARESSLTGWLMVLLLAVLALAGGVFAGIRIQDTRQLKRHGGFRI